MRLLKSPIILIAFFLSACSQFEKQNNKVAERLHPIKIPAKGTDVSPENILPANKVDFITEKIITSGNPTVVKAHTNVFMVPDSIPSFKIDTTTIEKITLGNNNVPYPNTNTPVAKPFLAGVPEVIEAKDIVFKDNNSGNFGYYSTQQGLNANTVLEMREDKIGNLWMSTWNGGVIKFDGKQFTNYTTKQGLPDNKVVAIALGKNDDIWFGTFGGGAVKFDGKYFTVYNTMNGLYGNVVLDIIMDTNGNLWFASQNHGVTCFDGKSFRNFTKKQGLCGNTIRSVIEDKKGNLWFGGQSCLSKFDGESFTNYYTKDGLSDGLLHNMMEDRFGNIWLTGKGVTKFDGTRFYYYREKEGFANIPVYSVFEDVTGNVWFGTLERGIFKYDGNRVDEIANGKTITTTDKQELIFSNGKFRKSVSNYTEKEGLPNIDITNFYQDKNDNIWFGTHGGLCKYNGALFTNFTKQDGLSDNAVLSIIENKKGEHIFGTGKGGFTIYNGKNFTQYTTQQGLINNMIFSIAADSADNLWLGTNMGIEKFDGKNFTKFDSRNNTVVVNTFKSKTGHIWFAADGAIKYDGHSFISFDLKQGLVHKRAKAFLEDDAGNLFVGTDSGLTKFTFDNHNNISSCTNFTEQDGLSNNWITSLAKGYDNCIWIGTVDGGLNRFKIDKNGKAAFTTFTEKEGLISNVVMSLLNDNNNNLWIGTRMGLSKFSIEKQKELDSITFDNNLQNILFKNYTLDEGFIGAGCNRGAMYQDSSGVIWIGTNNMLTAMHPQRDFTDTLPPNMQLTAISLFNENIDWNIFENNSDTAFKLKNGVTIDDLKYTGLAKWYNYPLDLNLAYNNNYITFNFLGISLDRSKQIKYRYRLVGLEQNWNAITPRTEANYGNLPHGNFTFQVQAMNSAGYWSGVFSYSFKIRPPWWLNWWFITSAVIALLLSIYSYLRWKTISLRVRQKQLEETVIERTGQLQELLTDREMLLKEIHHRVKNNLEVISSLLELQSEGIDDAKAKAAIIEGQNRVQSIALIHHKLYRTDDVGAVELKSFVTDLYNQVESVFIKPGVDVVFKIESGEIEISIDTAVPLGLIINELLTNSFKYGVSAGNNNQITIKIAATEHTNNYLLTYTDNGPGMPANFDFKKSTSLGFKVIQLLTKQLGGKLNFYNDGGSVFEVPFNNDKI